MTIARGGRLPTVVRLVCLVLATAALAGGADFGFQVIIRAGLSAGDWEIGIGNNLNSPAATSDVVPYWNNNAPRDFEIGYEASTNRAYVRVGNDIASYYPAGGGALAAVGTWTLPAASFYVSASSRPSPTGVTVSGLTLTTGMDVLQGFSTTTLTAAQPGGGSSLQSLALPVVLGATGSSSWVLTGQITFSGLPAASRSQLQFHLTAEASDVPEPATYAMIGGGLLALVALRGRR